MTVEILRKNRHTGRPMVFIKKDCKTIDDHIELLQAVKKEYGGHICVALPRSPMEVTKVPCGVGETYEKGYGEDVVFSIDQISSTLASVGEEIEW